MFKALLVIASMFLVAGVNTANAVSLPPVNTNIVNANQAQFIGSMITSQTNSSASSVIRQAVTPLNPQFKDCEACNAWVESLTTTSPGLIARFVGEGNGVGKNLPKDWQKYGYVGYIGGCSDITTGNSCSTPE